MIAVTACLPDFGHKEAPLPYVAKEVGLLGCCGKAKKPCHGQRGTAPRYLPKSYPWG